MHREAKLNSDSSAAKSAAMPSKARRKRASTGAGGASPKRMHGWPSCRNMNRLGEYAALNDEPANGMHELIRAPTDIE